MKNIDDLLSQVAQIKGVASDNEQKSVPTYKKEEIKVITDTAMTLKRAKEIITCVQKAAENLGKRVAVAVVNDNGRLVAFEAMDNTLLAATELAQTKAYTSAALRMTTAKALELSRGGDLDGLTNGNGLLLLGGGAPLFIGDTLVGALGVSGATKDEDTMFAEVGAGCFCEIIKTI